METVVFHTVNAGLYLLCGTCGILIDGLHRGAEIGLSDTPEEVIRQLAVPGGIFPRLDAVLFTHLHLDHFDRLKLLALLQTPYPPLVYGPELPETSVDARQISPKAHSFSVKDAQILALDTLHDGGEYRNTPHQSFLARFRQESLFIAGDALLQEAEADYLRDFSPVPISAAFVNFYQALSAQGQSFLRRLRPERILLCHLPFRRDDRFHYLSLAQRAQRLFPPDLPPLEIPAHMRWIGG